MEHVSECLTLCMGKSLQ